MKHTEHINTVAASASAAPVARGRVPGLRRSRGFTLLELLVVILIIGLLTGIVGPRFLAQISRSEVTTAKAQLDAIDKALQAYRIDMGRFPDTGEGLAALVRSDANDPRWRGPYLKGELPNDPWGMAYQYRIPSQQPGKDYELFSFGRDRVAGGTGDDADVQL
ncbi:type II secretion system major pseudopilin GspG [Roseateles sp. UC29_93]|uniref:type II secretion system major pseudopilin GspG n=1 Tax=Roseateles sp. UC29_93 TaxID=3350177 RepID=UPI00366B9CD6